MKRYSGAAAEKITTREQLPVGGYEVKIINAKEEVFDWGTKLVIAFDIAEGEQKGFYQKDFDNQQGEDKKWHGVYRIYEAEIQQFYLLPRGWKPRLPSRLGSIRKGRFQPV